MANNRNFWMALEKYVAKEQNFDATNEVKQKQKPQVKSNKEGHKKNGINVDDDKANEMMRQMSEKIFRRTLKKHNYQMSTENFFLAEGGYGSVFRVHQKGRKYACKVISNEMFQCKPDQAGAVHSSKLRSRFDNEVQIMKRVSSHPNIIGYVDSFSEVHATHRRTEEDPFDKSRTYLIRCRGILRKLPLQAEFPKCKERARQMPRGDAKKRGRQL
ncbi:hypothetical protein TYRP_019380 [Tyrophagus putrescentiae]|nr:hypothetical protein TYRP_019380 [Tyrophagus putrescentiae]